MATFLFLTTTYLVFSLDVLMVSEERSATITPRRRLDVGPRLRPDKKPAPVADSDSLFVLDESAAIETFVMGENENPQTMLRDLPASDGTNTEQDSSAEDSEFADALQSIGMAFFTNGAARDVTDSQEVANSAAHSSADMDDPPRPEEEEDDDEEPVVSGSKVGESSSPFEHSSEQLPEQQEEAQHLNGASSDEAHLSSSPRNAHDWKRIHSCKYGKSEKSNSLSYGTWVWRHKKGAVPHEDYTRTPSDAKLRHLKGALHHMTGSVLDTKAAVSAANEAGYTLCKIDLLSTIVVAWQPRLKGDALIFTRHGAPGADEEANISPLILEVPHTMFDHTLHQSLHVFSETKAAALILSESHRCSKSLTNKCTGNDGEPIRNMCPNSKNTNHNSDVAHAVQTCFHAAHEQLAEDYRTHLIASLHATKADEFILSDGTSKPTKQEAPVTILAQSLGTSLPQVKVGLCNEFPVAQLGLDNIEAVPSEKSIVCGATNVQGRHVNGAADPCRAKINRSGAELTPTGRFLHIEQPVTLVVPQDYKTTKPVMSKPLSEALLKALKGDFI